MGSKSSKHNLRSIQPLSQQTIDELCHDTGFDEDELVTWHTNFYKDCPDGKLTLKQFEHEYAKIMGKPTQKTANYIRHMFNVYDQDNNQFIDFKEFVMALSAASVVNRVRLVETLFHVFDLDNDGKITREEIEKMLMTLVDVTDSNEKPRQRRSRNNSQQEQNKRENLQTRIDEAFNELNANEDDHITKEEFIQWYMKSGLITDVQKVDAVSTNPSRINQIERKSRKLMKQSSSIRPTQDHDEHRQGASHLVRHMTRMTERRPATRSNNNENRPTTDSSTFNGRDDDDEENRSLATEPRIPSKVRFQTNIDDNSSQTSKENERWQHLFHSVLGQIRTQRQQQESTTTTTTTNGDRSQSGSVLWKRKVRENFQSGQFGQRSNSIDEHQDGKISIHDPLSTRNHRSTPSPDVVTIRL